MIEPPLDQLSNLVFDRFFDNVEGILFPRAIDSAKCSACSAFTLPGKGAVFGSTTASKIAGPGALRN